MLDGSFHVHFCFFFSKKRIHDRASADLITACFIPGAFFVIPNYVFSFSPIIIVKWVFAPPLAKITFSSLYFIITVATGWGIIEQSLTCLFFIFIVTEATLWLTR